ncbi:hypothetical protein FKM82_028207, partial [Ascaphus truei]
MSQEVKQRLELFSSYIEKILRPTYVLGYMSDWLPKGAVEQIKAEEQRGPTSAAAMFLKQLLELEAEGWYQGFLDSLNVA